MKKILLPILLACMATLPASAAPRIIAKSSYLPATAGNVLLPSDSTHYTYPPAPATAFPYYTLAEMYRYTSGAWLPFSKDEYTYDAQGLLTGQAHDQWNAVSSAYTHFSRWSYANNSSGLDTSQLNELWSAGAGAYVNSQRYTYTYDGARHVTGSVLEVWATYKTPVVWENSTRITKAYNPQGLLTVQTTENWDNAANVWAKGDRTTNTYDATGLYQTAYLYEGYDAAISGYYNVYRRAIVPDGTGRPVSSAYDTYNRTAAAWTPVNRIGYSYAASGNSDTAVLEQWNAGTSRFDSTTRQDFTYNSYHQLLTMSYLSRIGGRWGIGANAAQYNNYYEAAPADVSQILVGGIAFSFAPNPATGALNIQVLNAAPQVISVTLADMQGHVLLQYPGVCTVNGKVEISVADIPAGIYLVSVHGDGRASASQLVRVAH